MGESGALSGVSHACPVDSQGNLKGVGSADEYHCGAESTDGTYEFCKGASGSATTDVQCVGTSASSIQCLEECGDWWYQCANGAAFVKPVPVGTKCKSDSFVIEAVCTSGGASPTTSPPPSSTLAPTPAPVPSATTTPSAPTLQTVATNAMSAVGFGRLLCRANWLSLSLLAMLVQCCQAKVTLSRISTQCTMSFQLVSQRLVAFFVGTT